jgi:hypothetical protein
MQKSAGLLKRNESHLFYMQERWLVASLVVTAVKCKSVVFTLWYMHPSGINAFGIAVQGRRSIIKCRAVPLKLFNGAIATQRFMWLLIKWLLPCTVNSEGWSISPTFAWNYGTIIMIQNRRVAWFPESWDSKTWSWVPQDSAPRRAVLAKASSNLPMEYKTSVNLLGRCRILTGY